MLGAPDEHPEHPVFAGVGFISPAELSWTRFEAVTDVAEAPDHSARRLEQP